MYANRFKHRSSDRDTSVVIFLHWTRTVRRGKPYRASLSRGNARVSRNQGKITPFIVPNVFKLEETCATVPNSFFTNLDAMFDIS